MPRAPPARRRSRCATRRAAARTRNGTDSFCSTCSAIRRRRRASRRATTPTAASRCAWIPARRARPTRRSPGFVIRSNGQVVAECTADGVCPAIAAPNGERRNYEAFAVNAVGESLTSVTTTAWAYDPPARAVLGHCAPRRHRRRGRRDRARDRGHRARRDRQRRDHERHGRDGPDPGRPAPDEPRRPVLPGRDEHRHAGVGDAVLALRRSAGPRRQRLRRGRDRVGERHRGAAGRSARS